MQDISTVEDFIVQFSEQEPLNEEIYVITYDSSYWIPGNVRICEVPEDITVTSVDYQTIWKEGSYF